jgi:hypothetical protein
MNDTLTITRTNEQGYLMLRVGDRYAELTKDEALWGVAQWLMGGTCRYLKTKEEDEAEERRMQEIHNRTKGTT